MRKFLFLLSAALVASAVWAQTNAVVKKPANKKPVEQDFDVTSAHLLYDQNKSKLIYFDHVVVTNVQGNLTCARLIIDLPPQGSTNSQVTNAFAETNVIINIFKDGDTNHITCDQAVYSYGVVNAITNQTITFIGSSNRPAKMENSKGWMTGEPLVWDNVNKQFSGTHPQTVFKAPADIGGGSNSTPFGIPK
jgi:lipopolysaccharide export system protein LptA